MEDNNDIKELIESGYIVVLDTNVLLELYRYSPDYADFALECLERIKDNIRIPYTVFLEFKRHHVELYKKRQKSIDTSIEDSLTLVKNQMNKTLSSCTVLKKRNFPEIDILLDDIRGKYESIENAMNEYFDEHSVLSLIKDNWSSDRPEEFVYGLYRSEHVMTPFTQEQLYQVCDDGEKRYKNETPPGYKDAKNKDGIRKYSDLILWKETIHYAQTERKNIIFVTNDLKSDWWEQGFDGFSFRPELIDEFNKETKARENSELGKKLKRASQSLNSMTIMPFTLESFLLEVSNAFSIPMSDAIDVGVNLTAKAYVENIQELAFDRVMDEIVYSGTKYLDNSITRVGSEGIETWDVDSFDCCGYSVEESGGGIAVYSITYEVSMSGTSQDYWGRDDDTNEVILSGSYMHEVSGKVVVLVKRSVDFMIDFEYDDDFESVELQDATFSEVSFEDDSYEDDMEYKYSKDAYTTCPCCGNPINNYNDAGTGFCIFCEKSKDD